MNRKSFTLIEVLIVVAIIALVVGVVGGTLAAGIRALNTAQYFQSAECMALTGLEKMEKEINSAVFSSEVRFDGRHDRLTFRLPSCNDNYAMTARYFFDSANKSIFRNEWRMPLADYPDKAGELIAEGVISCIFSYGKCSGGTGNEIIWFNEWNNETNVPDAVRIDLQVEQKKGKEGIFVRRTFPLFSECKEKTATEKQSADR